MSNRDLKPDSPIAEPAVAIPVDPVLSAIASAPIDDMPESDEERAAVEEAKAGAADWEKRARAAEDRVWQLEEQIAAITPAKDEATRGRESMGDSLAKGLEWAKQLQDRLKTAEGLLRGVEWGGSSDDGTVWCPECIGERVRDGHRDGCELAAFLAGVSEPKETA